MTDSPSSRRSTATPKTSGQDVVFSDGDRLGHRSVRSSLGRPQSRGSAAPALERVYGVSTSQSQRHSRLWATRTFWDSPAGLAPPRPAGNQPCTFSLNCATFWQVWTCTAFPHRRWNKFLANRSAGAEQAVTPTVTWLSHDAFVPSLTIVIPALRGDKQCAPVLSPAAARIMQADCGGTRRQARKEK